LVKIFPFAEPCQKMLIVYHFIEYNKNGTSSVRRNDEEEGEGIKDRKKKKKRGFEDRRSEAKTERGVKYCERKKNQGYCWKYKIQIQNTYII
jgi:hypothetical protein